MVIYAAIIHIPTITVTTVLQIKANLFMNRNSYEKSYLRGRDTKSPSFMFGIKCLC